MREENRKGRGRGRLKNEGGGEKVERRENNVGIREYDEEVKVVKGVDR